MQKGSVLAVAGLAGVMCASAAHAGNAWVFDLRATPNRMLRFPAAAPVPPPASVVITNIGYDTFAMDFNSAATTLYAIQEVATGPGSIGTINQTTGAYTQIAPITGAAAAVTSFTGLKVDPTDETFFLSSGTDLYRIDPVTGVTTLVGPFGIPAPGGITIDIAIDRNGNMYAHDIGNDSFYSVNKTTGAATLIGPTGQPLANFAQGMDFDYADNRLYATLYTGGGTGAYGTFNLTTGTFQVITSTTPWNIEAEMAVDTPIPEPTTLSALALGGLALVRRRRA